MATATLEREATLLQVKSYFLVNGKPVWYETVYEMTPIEHNGQQLVKCSRDGQEYREVQE